MCQHLQVGVYSHDGTQLLGTGLSGPVRVLANNDVPTGAAYINLDVPVLCVHQAAALLPAQSLIYSFTRALQPTLHGCCFSLERSHTDSSKSGMTGKADTQPEDQRL